MWTKRTMCPCLLLITCVRQLSRIPALLSCKRCTIIVLLIIKPYGSFSLIMFLPLTCKVFVCIQNTLRKTKSCKSCVLCFETNRFLALLSSHFAVALVYISIKWYTWQETSGRAVNFQRFFFMKLMKYSVVIIAEWAKQIEEKHSKW